MISFISIGEYIIYDVIHVYGSKYVTQNLSTMNQGRLNHKMVLHVYKEMLDDLEFYTVWLYNEFVLESECQFGVFGNFE